jgi:MFS family permease
VFALFSYPFGRLADNIGYKTVLIIGFLLFSCVYFLFAVTISTLIIFIAFFIYGFYAAATEGVAKAWITKTADKTNTATAIGLYASCQSICALLASSIAGLIWYLQGSSFTFTVTAIGGLLVMLYFIIFLPRFRTFIY